jgi:hypothetical protein
VARILDNITLHWLTGTGVSAAREYRESAQASACAAGRTPPEVKLPVGFTTTEVRAAFRPLR